MDEHTLAQTRQELIRIGLIAYKQPLYQVLALQEQTSSIADRAPGDPQSLGQILKQLGGGAS